ncbi:hypothetical protein ZPAH1_orf00252 [Aeromonas phage ZPAH1]|nr:hypothetical protein ASwh1_203 [Aeromonas phage Aswh_1]QQG34014.1 hypothetical protein ZPAH1_orf00252 [Aeromonas phage ZPAH1]
MLINSKLFKDTLPVITVIIGIWVSIFSYNEFIADTRQIALKEEITSHMDRSIDTLRTEIKSLPNKESVETAQLRAMLYSKDLIDEVNRGNREELSRLEKRINDMESAKNDIPKNRKYKSEEG